MVARLHKLGGDMFLRRIINAECFEDVRFNSTPELDCLTGKL